MHREPLALLARLRSEHPRLFRRSRVLECGSYIINGSPRGMFADGEYTGIDWRAGPGVDVVSMVHEFESDKPFDVVLSTEMLEHDPHWQASVRAMVRQVGPGGALILTWASPKRRDHEIDCAPQDGYYAGIDVGDVLAIVNEAPGWWKIEASIVASGEDCQLVAMKPAVSVVIGTVGQPALVHCAVQEIRRLTSLPFEIVLVDNGSTAKDSALLKSIIVETLIHSERPLGYAAAYNAGIAACHGKYIVLLNNDAWPTHRGWDNRLASILEQVPGAMIAVPTASRCWSPDQRADGPQKDDCQLIESKRVAFVAVMLKREVLDLIGPLDERFGEGCFEDDDYCLRVDQAGGRIMIDPATFFFHVGGVTMHTLDDYAGLLKRNGLIFENKWKDSPGYAETTIDQTSG